MRQAVAFKSLKTMENYKNITSKVATVAYYMRGGCLRDVRYKRAREGRNTLSRSFPNGPTKMR